jgi:hypothetical protein
VSYSNNWAIDKASIEFLSQTIGHLSFKLHKYYFRFHDFHPFPGEGDSQNRNAGAFRGSLFTLIIFCLISGARDIASADSDESKTSESTLESLVLRPAHLYNLASLLWYRNKKWSESLSKISQRWMLDELGMCQSRCTPMNIPYHWPKFYSDSRLFQAIVSIFPMRLNWLIRHRCILRRRVTTFSSIEGSLLNFSSFYAVIRQKSKMLIKKSVHNNLQASIPTSHLTFVLNVTHSSSTCYWILCICPFRRKQSIVLLKLISFSHCVALFNILIISWLHKSRHCRAKVNRMLLIR